LDPSWTPEVLPEDFGLRRTPQLHGYDSAKPLSERQAAWLWARAQRTVRRFLGRGKSQSEEVDLPRINAELFAKIRVDTDGPEFDEAEAGMVIGRIERAVVTECEREGNNYRMAMNSGRAGDARAAHAQGQRDPGA